MNKTIATLVVCLLSAGAASAQPLQGHPTKQAYASPAEWPPIDDQCWVDDPNPLEAGHIHVVPRPPVYMRTQDWGTIDVPFTLKLHNISGVTGSVQGEHIRSVTWDATGSTTAPVLRGGGPNSLVEFTGVATVDHTLGDDGPDSCLFCNHIFRFPVHGWAEDRLFTRTAMDDGRNVDAIAVWSVYSAIDPSAPEKPAAEQGRPGVHIRTSCVVWSADPTETAGEVITEISDYIPLGPIFAPFTTIANVYNYTAPVGITFAPEVFQVRKDADLHHGIVGTLMRQLIVGPAMNKQFLGPITIDPADYGSGDHKVMTVWSQPLPTTPARSISAVLVFPVTVGVGVPPPTLCTDPNATNTGGPLPCVFPPPPVQLCTDPAATNVGQALPCTFPPPPVLCTDPKATSNGQPLPCVFPTPPAETTYTFKCDAAGNCTLTVVKQN